MADSMNTTTSEEPHEITEETTTAPTPIKRVQFATLPATGGRMPMILTVDPSKGVLMGNNHLMLLGLLAVGLGYYLGHRRILSCLNPNNWGLFAEAAGSAVDEVVETVSGTGVFEQ